MSLSSLLYYPTEHVAWAADLNILSIQSAPLWTTCIVLWIASLLASCTRSLVTLWTTGREIKLLQKRRQPQSTTASPPTVQSPKSSNGKKRVTFQDESTTSVLSSSHSRLRVLQVLYLQAAVKLAQNLSDMMNAIHYLPPGILWARKLPTLWVGIFGTISSLLGLYRLLTPPGPRPS